jgi:hypothetical protein
LQYAAVVPFEYYRRLGRTDKATYRKSDETVALTLPDAAALLPAIAAIGVGLAADDRSATGKAVRSLCDAMCKQLGAAPLVVRVLAKRPVRSDAELHGLYERDEDGTAVIRVWMRTAAHERVVAFRTFVRTLLHELCHHFDFELLRLRDTFHTEGFFKRESSLARQLLPPSERKRRIREQPVPPEPPPPAPPKRGQLGLF